MRVSRFAALALVVLAACGGCSTTGELWQEVMPAKTAQQQEDGKRVFLGVVVTRAPQELAIGVRVERVLKGSPADQAGIRPGDEIRSVGRTFVRSARDLENALLALDREDANPYPAANARLPVEPGVRKPAWLGVERDDHEGRGPLAVKQVVAGGPAERAGLQPNDVVVTVAGRRMTTLNDFKDMVNAHFAGEDVTVSIEREGGWKRDLAVQFGEETREVDEHAWDAGLQANLLAKFREQISKDLALEKPARPRQVSVVVAASGEERVLTVRVASLADHLELASERMLSWANTYESRLNVPLLIDYKRLVTPVDMYRDYLGFTLTEPFLIYCDVDVLPVITGWIQLFRFERTCYREAWRVQILTWPLTFTSMSDTEVVPERVPEDNGLEAL